jgi:hypothetical protein
MIPRSSRVTRNPLLTISSIMFSQTSLSAPLRRRGFSISWQAVHVWRTSSQCDLSGRKSWCESDDPAFAAKAADRQALHWVHEIKHDGYRLIVLRDGGVGALNVSLKLRCKICSPGATFVFSMAEELTPALAPALAA